MSEKELRLSSFMGALTHEIITRFVSSCLSWEVIGDELVMFAKVPVAGEGILGFAAGFKLGDLERVDMLELSVKVFDELEETVFLYARRHGCETTESSSSYN